MTVYKAVLLFDPYRTRRKYAFPHKHYEETQKINSMSPHQFNK